STFSIVPRTLTGGAAGGFCASAGSARSIATAAVTTDFRSIPLFPFFGAPTGATAAGICPARQLAQLKGERFDDSTIESCQTRQVRNLSPHRRCSGSGSQDVLVPHLPHPGGHIDPYPRLRL